MDKERKKWRTIIHIIIDVILFLSRQNFFFVDIVKTRLKVAIVKTLTPKIR